MDDGGRATAARSNPQREFIRHTADVPIEVRPVEGSGGRTERVVNVSAGGLSFITDEELEIGSTIGIRIAEVDPPFEAHARVVWTRADDGRYCVGVRFLDAGDAFRARMVEQVCSIERYRREVEEHEGRILTSPEAAAEWIGKYAGRFPEN